MDIRSAVCVEFTGDGFGCLLNLWAHLGHCTIVESSSKNPFVPSKSLYLQGNLQGNRGFCCGLRRRSLKLVNKTLFRKELEDLSRFVFSLEGICKTCHVLGRLTRNIEVPTMI